jgi:hypothetical protein
MSRILNRFLGAPTNHPLMPATAGLVRDFHTFVDARFSCRQLKRFVGIVLNWPMAASMA